MNLIGGRREPAFFRSAHPQCTSLSYRDR